MSTEALNTTTATETTPGNAAAKPEAKPLKGAKAKVKATKEIVLKAVNDCLATITKDQPAAQQSAIVEEAHRTLYNFAPDVEFSSNLEQKKAQREALRELRAELGFAQANLAIVNAMQKIKGAESTVRYSVRTLANGQVAGTETTVTKTAKRAGRGGIRT